MPNAPADRRRQPQRQNTYNTTQPPRPEPRRNPLNDENSWRRDGEPPGENLHRSMSVLMRRQAKNGNRLKMKKAPYGWRRGD